MLFLCTLPNGLVVTLLSIECVALVSGINFEFLKVIKYCTCNWFHIHEIIRKQIFHELE